MRGDLDGSVNLQFHYSVCAYVSSIFNLESTIIQHLALPKSTFVFITAVSARPEDSQRMDGQDDHNFRRIQLLDPDDAFLLKGRSPLSTNILVKAPLYS